MAIVCRVEHKLDQSGPYVSKYGGVHDDLHERHGSSKYHVGIMKDTRWEFNPVFDRCGFDSLSKLRLWFKGFLRRLKAADYVVAFYRVEEIFPTISGRQIAFDSTQATRLHTQSLLDRNTPSFE
jgi:hypothetical protein